MLKFLFSDYIPAEMAASEDLDGKSILEQTDIIEVTEIFFFLGSSVSDCAYSLRLKRKSTQIFMV